MTFGWSYVLAVVAIFLLPLLGCGFLGAGNSVGPGPGSTPSLSQAVVEPGPGHVSPPAATPWPTFTPVPTPDSLAYIHPGADADSLAYLYPGADALAQVFPGARRSGSLGQRASHPSDSLR